MGSRSLALDKLSLTSYGFLVSAIGDIIGFIAAIKILPQTIAEYCFNKEEDAAIAKLFLNAQKHDKIIHGIH